jgi:MOSC domain-containing protein YiiM
MAFLDDDEHEFKHLMGHFKKPGQIVWMGVRPGTRKEVEPVEKTIARVGMGLDGDRFKGTPDSKRQVTFIQGEHLDAVASFLGLVQIDPALVRRNIVVRGINLSALKGKKFKVGDAVFEMSGFCYPCSRMEEVLGEGGYNAMRGHGGILAKVLQEGSIQIGDQVMVLEE